MDIDREKTGVEYFGGHCIFGGFLSWHGPGGAVSFSFIIDYVLRLFFYIMILKSDD